MVIEKRHGCLIFMDIDGVLATPNSIYDSPRDKRTVSNDWYPYHFDPVAVGHLNDFTDRLESPLIIVSSVWRLGRRLITLREIFAKEGVKARVYGSTSYLDKQPRGAEIRQWVDNFYKDLPWVVFDDDRDMDGCFEHFVHVNNAYGLLPTDTEKAFEILARQGCYATTDPRPTDR